jgi:hypothetical protein
MRMVVISLIRFLRGRKSFSFQYCRFGESGILNADHVGRTQLGLERRSTIQSETTA